MATRQRILISLRDLVARAHAAPAGVRYALAVALAVAGIATRASMPALVGESARLMTLYPVVIVSAWLSGLGPGLVAVALCAVAAWYMWLPPEMSWTIS